MFKTSRVADLCLKLYILACVIDIIFFYIVTVTIPELQFQKFILLSTKKRKRAEVIEFR